MWSHKTTWSKGHVILWQDAIKVGYHPIKFGGHMHFDKGDSGFSLLPDLGRPRDERVMWIYEPIKVSYCLAKFGGDRQCDSRDIFFSLSRSLNVMTSPAPTWLVPFQSNPEDVPACQILWS